MVSLSFDTVHMCDDQNSAHVGPSSEAKMKGLRSTICSAGFKEGTRPCRSSAWGEENGICHADLQEVDNEIQGWVPAILARELAQFEIYHRDGIIPGERTGCHIL